MKLYRALTAVLQAIVVAGLAAAYFSTILGLTSSYDAARVTAVTLCGIGVALLAAILYFGAVDFKLSRTRRAEE